jgi:hypothetical protein
VISAAHIALLTLEAKYANLQPCSVACVARVAPLRLGTNYASFLKSCFVIWLAHLTPLTLEAKYANLQPCSVACVAYVLPLASEANQVSLPESC